MYDIMTPGPTQVRENVRQARALACTNPDLDADFYDFYKETCEEISELLYTKNETLILDGEGILGLEAACATLTEKGDRVLVMDNGEYGKGFAGFVTMYGGEPVLYSTDYRNAFDVKALEEYLENRAQAKKQQLEMLNKKIAKMELERSRQTQSWNSERQMAKASNAYDANIMMEAELVKNITKTMEISNNQSYYINPNTRQFTSNVKNTAIKDREVFNGSMQNLLNPIEDLV